MADGDDRKITNLSAPFVNWANGPSVYTTKVDNTDYTSNPIPQATYRHQSSYKSTATLTVLVDSAYGRKMATF